MLQLRRGRVDLASRVNLTRYLLRDLWAVSAKLLDQLRNALRSRGRMKGEERNIVFAAATRPPIVDIEPKGQAVVRLGDSLRIMCTMGSPLQICRVEIHGESSMILRPNQSSDDGIEYYGEGTNKGQCGVHIFKVKEQHNGIFRCALTPEDRRVESNASVIIVVAKSPNNPELHTSLGHYGRYEYQKGQKLEISCSASGGRPPANVSLYLDDEPLGIDERPTIYEDSNMNEVSIAVQNASRSLDWTDNSKTLRCIANHIALDKPKESKMQLQVYYPPQPQPVIEHFGYVIGQQGTVNVTVYANPRPRFLWRVNGEKIEEGRPDESNRLETSTAVDLGNGAWLVVLTIDSVQKSDTQKEYILEAHNKEGAYEYRIVLSTSPEPAGVDLDAGSIIGIVVGALVLILIVFLVIFARATGRWCFAARRRGDEEAAGGISAGSEAHITPADDEEEDEEDPRIIDEKIPQGGQENPIHASTEYVNGRTNDFKDTKKDEKTDTPV
ncbi:fasciclin-3-like isoform X5 [Vespula squamosa]|uniref:Fasciclin-3-like isoform X5 n=1 Tax=Vespula squamosa TaxID=30214 RepID=A0ABD1ZT98_VESSQ